MRVVGIDPGSWKTGWGVVEQTTGCRVRYVASGTINTRGSRSFAVRLKQIHEGVRSVLREWAPEAVGLEAVFVARNIQAAFRLGEARGAALVGAAGEGFDVYEYAPATVKLAVAGSGRADKDQVARGVAQLLGIEEKALGRDATDALAVAVCHLHTVQLSGRLEPDGRLRAARPGHRRIARRPRGASETGTAGSVGRVVLTAGRVGHPRTARRRIR